MACEKAEQPKAEMLAVNWGSILRNSDMQVKRSEVLGFCLKWKRVQLLLSAVSIDTEVLLKFGY